MHSGSILSFFKESPVLYFIIFLTMHGVMCQSPAKIVQPPQDTKAIAGEFVLFACRAEGNPIPRLVFQWNDNELSQSRPGLQLKATGPESLSLRAKLEPSHNGDIISCFAQNQVGSDVASAQITVYSANETPPRGFPKVLQDPSATISQVGSSAHMQCEVSADPPATVSWIKDHFYPVDLSTSRFRLVGPGSLTIETLQESDSGSYECMARNVVGTVLSNSGHLHVRRIQFPPSIHEMPDRVNVAPGHRANLTCRAGGFPVPMVWWSTMGSPVGLQNLGLLMMTERPLTEPQPHEAILRLTDITESHDYYCMAKNGLGLVRRNVSVIVNELPAPPTELDVRPIGGTYAMLRWLPSNSTGVNSYTISLEVKDHELGHLGRRQIANIHPEESVNPSSSDQPYYSYNLTGLTPYTQHVASVYAVSSTTGLSPPSKPVHFRTSELAPSSPPQALHANVISPNSIMISWKPPLEPNGRITGYKLYHTTRSDDPLSSWLVTRASVERYQLTHLMPNATYYIRVNAYNPAGDGPVTQVLPVVVTPGVPSAPANFHGTSIDPTTIHLVWKPPELGEVVRLQGYQLRYRASATDQATDVTSSTHPALQTARTILVGPELTEYMLKDLQPSTLYHISLAGQTINGIGVGAQIEVITNDRLPEVPQGRRILVHGSTTIQVTWNGPRERSADVRHYKLMWKCVDCTLTLDPTAPNGADSYLPDPARVGQRKVLANNGQIPNYVYTATIGDLIPDTSYQVSIAAVNARGTGQAYFYPIARTGHQAPLRPKNLHLVSIHKRPRPQPTQPDQSGFHGVIDLTYLSIELAWDPPDELRTSQQITYQVFVCLVGPEELMAELSEKYDTDALGVNGIDGKISHTDDTTFDIAPHPWARQRLLANVTGNTFRSSENDNIAHGAVYQFEVSLFNVSHPNGPPVRLNVTTPDAAPSTSPLHVRLSGLSSNAVEVSWAPPPINYRNGRITGYQVRYFEVGAEAQTETTAKVTAPGQRQYTAKNLKEKTYYTFMLRAFTSAGPGPWSGASNIRTSVELPPPPLDIRATRINQHQIKVTWRIPNGEELGAGSRHLSIQGFRLLYSSNNNPYEAGQWTSFDVGPVNMAIISHLDTKSSYVICIKSRGQDGRYGDCSQPVIGRTAATGEEPDFSVQNLLCTGDETSVKVTWHQPVRTKQLEGFKLRVGGSKRFADSYGVTRTVEFPARSVSVAYASVHSGYTYTVSDLEPNSVYDVQVSAYYEMSLGMESNWETTSCYTQMQRPPYVVAPIAVAVCPTRRQVLLQLTRVSERFGKIRHYFLLVAPIHLADGETNKIDIENTITTSRGLPSSGTRYLAAKYQQNFFDPPPRNARNFTLGGLVAYRARRSTDDQLLERFARKDPQTTDVFTASMDAEMSFDNKVLVDGQEYKAFVRACVFQTDHSNVDGPSACTSSDWSLGFGPDRELPPQNMMMNTMQDFEDFGTKDPQGISESPLKSHTVFGYAFANNDLFVVTAAAVIVGLALIAIICIAFGCFMRRKRRPKLLTHATSSDPSLKQPLIRMNDCIPSKGANFTMCTSGIDLVATNINAHSASQLINEQCSSITAGQGSVSIPGSQIIPSSPPMIPHASLLSSMTAAIGRAGVTASGTPSPVTGLSHQEHMHHHGPTAHLCNISSSHSRFSSSYTESNTLHPSLQSGANCFTVGRVGTMSSHAGSHASSLTGAPSAVGSATGVGGSNFSAGAINISGDPGAVCDSLVISRDVMNGGQDFIMSSLAYESKGPAMKHPIPINCLADHVARLSAADNLLFAQEYESIETERQFTWEHSNMEVNKPKNRYANVIAYDHSRVILQSIEGVPGSDYINANYIDGYKRPNAYIATQGPMPDTYSDFWRMIWEQRVFIIVMMTRLEERSRVKCDQYWPSRSPASYAGGLLTVTPIDTIELAYYTIRTFNLTARGIDDECREVRHFQFTSWPDHGVPEYPIPLLLFIRRVRATLANSNSSSSSTGQTSLVEQGPIVVHCSAGVGRTGAFIVVDMMLERIKYEKTVDIYGCVKALRSQRNFTVQTEDQYIFIHSALLEASDAGNTEVPARNLLAHVRKLRMLDATGGSGMELEFKKLQQFRMPRAKYTSAQLLCNRTKNRLASALPYESTRVALQPIRGVEGSDYVNASFVDSYRERKAYIATQGPMAKTVEDFWRMVWEYNSMIVVMLTKFVERGVECCYPYWPSERSARYQYYVVDPMVEYSMPNYTLREFKLTDARDGQSRTLRQFQFTDWPEHGVPDTCEAFIEFLGQVHKTKEQFGQDGPITVHCSNGVGQTGVFLTLSIVLDRMRYEGVVDMFQTVRMLRTQRLGLVETEDQYRFCYNAALEYLSSFDHYATG